MQQFGQNREKTANNCSGFPHWARDAQCPRSHIFVFLYLVSLNFGASFSDLKIKKIKTMRAP
jgi:hypothetical protein